MVVSLSKRRLRICLVAWAASDFTAGVAQLSAQGGSDGARASMFPAQAPVTSNLHPIPSATVSIPGVILLSPGSSTSLPIEVTPVDIGMRGVLLRLRGLPEGLVLSEGHVIAPGSWAVPIAALPRLRVTVPQGLSGKSDLTASLVTIDGSVLAEARSAILIAAAGLIAPSQQSPAATGTASNSNSAPDQANPTPPPSIDRKDPAPAVEPRSNAAANRAPAAPLPPPAQSDAAPNATPQMDAATLQKVAAMLARARALMLDGNIVAARLFFERATEAGSADAALALGGTYDPAELRRMMAHGLKADIEQARRWYEKAASLGSAEAVLRLKRLGARPG